ncbi:MAG: hypothetical protein HY079_10030 [Elusimicrobia bacterium]|nr:hypothetical protein [Elusimicrobiota bacterium]
MKAREFAVVAIIVIASSCASWRLGASRARDGRPADASLHGVAAEESRHPAPPVDAAREDAAALAVSTYAVRAPRAEVPPTPADRAKDALYYSDMGPDTVDVSAYPTQIQRDYQTFARTCARCHTLARAINAPLVGRGWWEFYILGMRMRSRRTGQPLGKDETTQILDFLEHDAKVRKVDRARDFDALTEELKSRFDASVSRRMKALQKGQSQRLQPGPGR